MKILVIGHEASRTGAPILLLSLVNWLVGSRNADVRCLLWKSGSLQADYELACETLVSDDGHAPSVFDRVSGRLGLERKRQVSRLKRWLGRSAQPDLIYVSTVAGIAMLQQVQELMPQRVPTLIHVHELESELRYYQKTYSVGPCLDSADLVLAGSHAVKTALLQEFGEHLEPRMRVVHGWLCHEARPFTGREQARSSMRELLQIEKSARICLSVGSLDWRKGPEFVPMIARQIHDRCKDLHFVWIGGDGLGRMRDKYLLDAERLGVSKRVHFLQAVEDLSPFFLGSDFFALTSREDPYPLVMIDAAAYQLPVVCFVGSGGAPEFVSDSKGIAVPNLDLVAFANAVALLYEQPKYAVELADNARRYVENHHTREGIASQIWDTFREATTHNRKL